MATLLVLLTLTGAVPVFLVRWGGWPLSDAPGWDRFRRLPLPSTADQVIIGVLSLALWGIWGQFVGRLVAEVVTHIRRRRPPARPDDRIWRLAHDLVRAVSTSPATAAGVTAPSLPALGIGADVYADPESRHLRTPATPVGLPAGGLALAGAVLTLDRRRRVQQRHRAAGRRIAMASPDLALHEHVIRSGTDAAQARLVECALRAAAAGSGATGLPGVRWVEATAETVVMALDRDAPAPPGFTSIGQSRWQTNANADRLTRLAGRTAMPTPTLTPVGTTHDSSALLVDLESSGVVSVVGGRRETLEVLRAIAVAAATAAWAEPSSLLQVVGHAEPLVELPDAHTASHLAEALTVAEARLERTALAVWGVPCDTAAQARAAGVSTEECKPLVVVSTVPAGDTHERRRLAVLAARPNHAVVVVVPATGDGAARGRRFELDGDGWLRMDGVDPLVRPYRLSDDDARVLATLLESASRREALPRADHADVPAVRVPPNGRAGVTAPSGETAANVNSFAEAIRRGMAPTRESKSAPRPASPPFAVDPAQPAAVEEPPDRDVADRDAAADGERADDAAPADTDEVSEVEEAAEPALDSPDGEPVVAGKAAKQGEATAKVRDAPAAVAASTPPPPVRRLDDILGEVDILVRVLGDVEAVRPAQTSATRSGERLVPARQKALEALVYLALSDSGVSRRELERILFPTGTTSAKIVYNTVKTVLKLVGDHPMPATAGPHFVLSERVVTDYGIFCDLAAQAARAEAVDAAATLLGDALDLVRGEPFTGTARSYTWAASHRAEMVAQVIDTAEALAEIRLAEGDWQAAETAARQGLRAFPADERMYRLIMRAAKVGRNTTEVRRVFGELCDVIADPDHGVQPEDSLHPETVALFDALTTSNDDRVGDPDPGVG